MPKRSAAVPRQYTVYKKKLAKEIGSRLQTTRRGLQLTQNEIRERLQLESVILTRSQHSRIERGDRLPDALEILALSRVLRVTTHWLLTGEKDQS